MFIFMAIHFDPRIKAFWNYVIFVLELLTSQIFLPPDLLLEYCIEHITIGIL